VSSLSVPYVLGGTLTEQQRLIAQAQGLEAHARWMLDRIPIKPGFRAVDVGCGPIGIMNLLSERVGSDGAVVGVEREPRFVEMARAELSERGLRNVQVVNADALRTGLEKGSYDVVHERLVLINVPAASQEAILAEMFSLVRPGGIIALQEFDEASYVCYPEHPSWNILLGIWNDAFHAAGGNEFVGRSLARQLRSAGAENIQMKAHVEVAQIGEYRRTHLLSLIESMRDLVLASGRIEKTEFGGPHGGTVGASRGSRNNTHRQADRSGLGAEAKLTSIESHDRKSVSRRSAASWLDRALRRATEVGQAPQRFVIYRRQRRSAGDNRRQTGSSDWPCRQRP
jgi:SAM-dependent methyltransferase